MVGDFAENLDGAEQITLDDAGIAPVINQVDLDQHHGELDDGGGPIVRAGRQILKQVDQVPDESVDGVNVPLDVLPGVHDGHGHLTPVQLGPYARWSARARGTMLASRNLLSISGLIWRPGVRPSSRDSTALPMRTMTEDTSLLVLATWRLSSSWLRLAMCGVGGRAVH